MYLYHIGYHLSAHKGVVDAVGALALAVTYVRAEVPGPAAAGFGYALFGGLHQLIQMPGARVAVAEGALHKNLRLC